MAIKVVREKPNSAVPGDIIGTCSLKESECARVGVDDAILVKCS